MSHFDRYANIKPAYGSITEYNKQFSSITKRQLLAEAEEAIAWGSPDNESIGYSHTRFISLIKRMKDYIEAQ